MCINTILYAYLDDEFTKKIFDKGPRRSILFDLSFADNKSLEYSCVYVCICVCTLNEHTKRSNFDADKLTLTGNEWARARITIPQTDYTAGLYLNIINNKQVQTILV